MTLCRHPRTEEICLSIELVTVVSRDTWSLLLRVKSHYLAVSVSVIFDMVEKLFTLGTHSLHRAFSLLGCKSRWIKVSSKM